MVQSRAYLGALLTALPSVRAGFNASSTQNIAVYWGELNGLSRLQLPINTYVVCRPKFSKSSKLSAALVYLLRQ